MLQRCLKTCFIPLLVAVLLLNAEFITKAQGPVKVYRAANFTVNYNPTSCQGTTVPWPAEAQTALNHTVDILDDLINSAPTIEIDACYENSADPDTLAAAGPTDTFDQSQVASLPLADVGYGVALANAISGQDNNGDRSEIDLTVNSAIAWNFSTTLGATPNNEFDFVSTVLHELIHGLGFVDTSEVNGGSGSLGDNNGLVSIYDTFLVDNGGSPLTGLPNNSTALANALQAGSGGVQWSGPNAVAANSNARPIIYAPNPYEQGSSIGHLDDNSAENAGRLMRAATGEGPGSHTPSAITLMILKDIGWSINDASDYGDLPAAYALTTKANDGARHIKNSLTLGSITTEPDGTTSDAAAADVGDDGVTRSGNWSNGANGGSVQVNVTGARGCLSGWIDWNGDNDFADAGEQVAAMQPVNVGSQLLSFAVPAGTFNGTPGPNVTVFARFRVMPDIDGDGACDVSEQKALAAQGTVYGGEVEDHRWQFDANGSGIFPAPHFIFLPVIIR